MGNTGEIEADLEHLDKEALKTIQELFGEKPINVQQPRAIFITKLEKVLGEKIPPEIFSELVDGKIITPHMLINTFGRGIQSIAKFICYHKPSLFLHKHESFTQKLITLSRIEINVQLDQTTFTPNHWKRVKKSSSFEQIFEKKTCTRFPISYFS